MYGKCACVSVCACLYVYVWQVMGDMYTPIFFAFRYEPWCMCGNHRSIFISQVFLSS